MHLALIFAVALILFLPSAVEAKEYSYTIHWNVQRSELSIARMRVMLGPKITKAACKSYWNLLKSGNTVRVTFVGAASETITSFLVTGDMCHR